MTTIHKSSPEDPPRAQPCKEDRRQRATRWCAAQGSECDVSQTNALEGVASGLLFFLTIPFDQLDFALELADFRAGGVDFRVDVFGLVSP